MNDKEIDNLVLKVAQALKPSIVEEVGKVKEAFTKDIQDLRKDVVALGAKQQNPAFDAGGLAKELQSAFGGLGLGNPSNAQAPQAPAQNSTGFPNQNPSEIPGSQMQMPNLGGGAQNPMALIQMIMSFINTPVGAKLAGIEVPGMTQQNPMMTMMSEMLMRGMVSNFYNQTMQFQNMNNYMMKKMMTDPKTIEDYNKTMGWLNEPIAHLGDPNYKPSPMPKDQGDLGGKVGHPPS